MVADLLLQGNRERDRRVGELAGWHIEFQSDTYFLIPPGLSLDGPHTGIPFGGADTPDDAWRLYVPEYSTSANASLALVADFKVTLRNEGGSPEVLWSCHLFGWREDYNLVPYAVYANGATPALAICHAWLAWKEGQA